ncbi:response regulator transcription factor [Cellulosilyticum sp. I15G10I2]|uniref:response regulator transcription factor n=1 Tax=Cellulosilyticum sp. I15G10I2 TaxID=1892843 RepID=UPI00085BDB55|nr:response regulator transcription factor [Cellulosilyticum sp. I15G10I2]
MTYTLLVCDDDKLIVNSIALHLQKEGYRILKAYDGLEALELIRTQEVHLVLLDVMMPKLDGLSTTLRIRQEKNIPIIILSAKSEDTDKIAGLNFGADDYMTKPFNTFELLARVKSQLRRYTTLGCLQLEKQFLVTGGLMVDTETGRVTVDGELIKLTPTEYKILVYLMKNMGIILSINQIYENVWQDVAYAAENTVAVHIRRLREKIEINPKEPKYVKVVWGSGYLVEKM